MGNLSNYIKAICRSQLLALVIVTAYMAYIFVTKPDPVATELASWGVSIGIVGIILYIAILINDRFTRRKM